MDVHKGEGGGPTHVERGRVENPIFCGRHKWMAPKPQTYNSRKSVEHLYSADCRVIPNQGNAALT